MPQPGLPLVHMHPGTDSQPERSQFKLTGNGANSSYHIRNRRSRYEPYQATDRRWQNGHDVSELADTITQVIALGAVGYNLEDIDATGVLRSVNEATA
ncbi:hypothetical protein DTO013E5_7914 [Penicillium roqueforti]|nr:hypothetical protein CBS147372_1272 [Penicillium roqueforti]KAI2726460.1 hypothetical protein CBS147332_3347 [Penicillium roqueforti]KAI2742077.1 hypothetical protein DTO012A1_4061 [Penicillium roqueforti]KAI2774069.1 hypothetical protein DTO012A8_1378 [Penicillium roqueforti]KAI3074498.1 hypothetical protein CBS147339_5875 [Penicillium roqueforti]